jgi:hypothetical protein
MTTNSARAIRAKLTGDFHNKIGHEETSRTPFLAHWQRCNLA